MIIAVLESKEGKLIPLCTDASCEEMETWPTIADAKAAIREMSIRDQCVVTLIDLDDAVTWVES